MNQLQELLIAINHLHQPVKSPAWRTHLSNLLHIHWEIVTTDSWMSKWVWLFVLAIGNHVEESIQVEQSGVAEHSLLWCGWISTLSGAHMQWQWQVENNLHNLFLVQQLIEKSQLQRITRDDLLMFKLQLQ